MQAADLNDGNIQLVAVLIIKTGDIFAIEGAVKLQEWTMHEWTSTEDVAAVNFGEEMTEKKCNRWTMTEWISQS